MHQRINYLQMPLKLRVTLFEGNLPFLLFAFIQFSPSNVLFLERERERDKKERESLVLY